jgi:hypothetical protein
MGGLLMDTTPWIWCLSLVLAARFSNGRPASGSSLKCTLLKEDHPNRKGRYTLEAETPRVYYSGDANQHTARKEGVYMVGVRERATGVVQMYDAALFQMQSTVKAAEIVSADNRDVSSAEQQIAARAQLTEAFGGKKKRQAASAKLRYAYATPTLFRAL